MVELQVPLFLLLSATISRGEFIPDYMTQQCNKVLSGRSAGRLETSTSLTYSNLMDCFTTISVPEGKQILLLFQGLEFEEPLNGVCVDYLNIHDGPSTQSATLNTAPLCNRVTNLKTMTTTGNHVTFYFRTDNNAVYRGFDIIYTAFTPAPCSPIQFLCGNQVCVDLDLKCDGLQQCVDGSDEDEQLCKVEENNGNNADTGIIVGSAVGGFIFLIIVIVLLYKLIDYLKWRRFLKKHNFDRNPYDLSDDIYQYPISDKYQRYDIGMRGRRDPVNFESDTANKLGKLEDPVSREKQGKEDVLMRSRTPSAKLAAHLDDTNKPPSLAGSMDETKKTPTRSDSPVSAYPEKKHLIT